MNEFRAGQEQELTYYDINLMLNSAWEVLSEVPTVADESLEERIQGLTSELDDFALKRSTPPKTTRAKATFWPEHSYGPLEAGLARSVCIAIKPCIPACVAYGLQRS